MARIITGTIRSSGTLADLFGASILDPTVGSFEIAGSAFRLLLHLAQSNLSGVLAITGPESSVAVSIVGSSIAKTHAEGETEDGAMAVTILENDLLGREKLLRAATQAEASGKSLIKTIFELGFMEPLAVVRLMKANHRRHLATALETREGKFTWAQGDVLPGFAIKLGPAPLPIRTALNELLSDALKAHYYDELEGILTPLREYYLRVPEAIVSKAVSLGFDKRQLHTLESLLDGSYRYDDINRLSVMSRNGVARLIFVLSTLGLLDKLDKSTRVITIHSPEEELAQRLAELESKDFFQRVGSHWSAPQVSNRRAYEARSAEFGPGGTLRTGAPEIGRLASEIWTKMEEAWGRIKSKESRRAYRAGVVETTQLRFSADLMFAQGKTYEIQHDFDKAREVYETAQELHPTEQFEKALKRLDAIEFEWMKRLREKERGT